MRLIYVALALAGIVLAACEAPPATDSEVTSEVTQPTVPPPSDGNVAVERVVGEIPGSPEDFVVSVGDRVLFGLDRYELTEEARVTVENQVIWLQRYPNITVTVEGHTDERGTREYNLALGERRAISVRDYMIALGIDGSRIRTISYGKERPIDPSSNEEAWQVNRRAVTVVADGTG